MPLTRVRPGPKIRLSTVARVPIGLPHWSEEIASNNHFPNGIGICIPQCYRRVKETRTTSPDRPRHGYIVDRPVEAADRPCLLSGGGRRHSEAEFRPPGIGEGQQQNDNGGSLYG